MPNPSPDEATARRDLAAAYRLAARRGWDDIVWTHISAALPGEPGAYLINRFGLRLAEVRPDNLVKVDVQGRVIDGSGAPVNPSGFTGRRRRYCSTSSAGRARPMTTPRPTA